MSDYTYKVSSFPNQAVAIDRLTLEINQSSISIALSSVNLDAGICTVSFKVPLSASEVTVLNSITANHSGLALPEPVNPNGIPLVALEGKLNKVQLAPREGSEVIKVTHDFCDPTTWYYTSNRVTEVLTVKPGTSGLTWVSANKNWIDLEHGKVHDESSVVDEHKVGNPGSPHGYLVSVSVDGTTLKRLPPHLEVDPFVGAGDAYDYRVNYLTGEVTFKVAPSSPPQASYSYAKTAEWFVAPKPGKALVIENAEIQWTDDISMDYDIIQEAQVPITANPDPLNPTHWMMVDQTIYKSFLQIVDEARGSFPKQGSVKGTPAFRGSNGVGIEHTPLIYSAVKELTSSLGLRMKIYIGNSWYDEDGVLQVSVATPDNVNGGGGFGGTRATASFYAISVVEGS